MSKSVSILELELIFNRFPLVVRDGEEIVWKWFEINMYFGEMLWVLRGKQECEKGEESEPVSSWEEIRGRKR